MPSVRESSARFVARCGCHLQFIYSVCSVRYRTYHPLCKTRTDAERRDVVQVGPIAQRWVRGYLSKKFPSCEFASFLGAVCCCLHTEAGTDLVWPGRSTVLSSSFICECHLLFDRSFSRLAWPGQPTVGVAKGATQDISLCFCRLTFPTPCACSWLCSGCELACVSTAPCRHDLGASAADLGVAFEGHGCGWSAVERRRLVWHTKTCPRRR
jgi:hypothetical protein